MKRFSEYINEMARKDIEGAEDEIKAKDWNKAARIYIFNAKKRGFNEKKIRSGLGSTFKGQGSPPEDIKVGDITLTNVDAWNFKAAIQKELGKTAPTKRQKERQSAEKKYKKAPEQRKIVLVKKKKVMEEKGFDDVTFFSDKTRELEKERNKTKQTQKAEKKSKKRKPIKKKKVMEQILQSSDMIGKYLGEKDYCKNMNLAKDVEEYECKEHSKKFKSKKSYNKHMKKHKE